MGKSKGFVLGAAVGAIAALFLSPNSGARNREVVAEKAGYYAANGGEIVQRAAEAVRGKGKGLDEEFSPAADDIRDRINAARDRIAEQVTRNRGAQDVEADVTDVAQDILDDVEAPVSAAADDQDAPSEEQ